MDMFPTDEEIRMASDVIKRTERGNLPVELFYAVTSKVATPTMEAAPIRLNSSGIAEILLTKRPDDDPYWPGEWHIPGTVLRASDEPGDFSSGFKRVLESELKGAVKPTSGLIQVSVKFWDVRRGRELDFIHYFLTETPDSEIVSGTFFDIESLPETTMEHHQVLIKEIAQAVRSSY